MQAYAYIPQTHNQWQLRGKHIFIWGGEMLSARLHSPLVPSLGQRSMAREASTCAQPLSPFHARLVHWRHAQTCNKALGMVPLL
jgi:hypothetical protein